jgi:hypothetical protein
MSLPHNKQSDLCRSVKTLWKNQLLSSLFLSIQKTEYKSFSACWDIYTWSPPLRLYRRTEGSRRASPSTVLSVPYQTTWHFAEDCCVNLECHTIRLMSDKMTTDVSQKISLCGVAPTHWYQGIISITDLTFSCSMDFNLSCYCYSFFRTPIPISTRYTSSEI